MKLCYDTEQGYISFQYEACTKEPKSLYTVTL